MVFVFCGIRGAYRGRGDFTTIGLQQVMRPFDHSLQSSLVAFVKAWKIPGEK